MDERRKLWNERQKILQTELTRGKDLHRAVALFMNQHAMIHAAQVSGLDEESFEDSIWNNLPEAGARSVPNGFVHSIAWMAWHLTRCEDITMNLLVAGHEQVMDHDDYLSAMQISFRDTGNTMDAAGLEIFNRSIELGALRAYRIAVGRQTRAIVQALPESAFRQPVDPARAEQLIPMGVVLPEARGLVDYWGSRTIAGLLLMPATRHAAVHWNEAERLKKKLR